LRDDGRLQGGGEDAAPLRLPDTVRDTLRRRLEPLDSADRELLSLASVVGREFDVVLLTQATGNPPETVLAYLTAATATGLVEETATIGRFRFAHALVHEAVYGDLLPAARAHLHRRVAEAREAHHATLADAPLGELAAHYARAAPLGTAAKAVECSVRAAEQATALFAYGDAILHYERALAALALLAPDERKRLEICLPLGSVAGRGALPQGARGVGPGGGRRARARGQAVLRPRGAEFRGGEPAVGRPRYRRDRAPRGGADRGGRRGRLRARTGARDARAGALLLG